MFTSEMSWTDEWKRPYFKIVSSYLSISVSFNRWCSAQTAFRLQVQILKKVSEVHVDFYTFQIFICRLKLGSW